MAMNKESTRIDVFLVRGSHSALEKILSNPFADHSMVRRDFTMPMKQSDGEMLVGIVFDEDLRQSLKLGLIDSTRVSVNMLDGVVNVTVHLGEHFAVRLMTGVRLQ